MIALNYKAKHYLFVALKIFILALTFWYIYNKITQNESLNLNKFLIHIFNYGNKAVVSFSFFLLLASANWIFEILKWKTIVSEVQNLSFFEAMKQSLVSLTISLSTPNRIGEYGAKAFLYKSDKRKNIILLTFFSNALQMGVTTLFGIIGLLIIIPKYQIQVSPINLILGAFILLTLINLGIIFKKQSLIIKGFTISKVFLKFNILPFELKIKMIVYSFIRYLIFGFLFYSLLHFFGAEISLLQSIPLIFAMYLMVSVIPSIFIFDVVIRGGAALWVFSLAGISEITILSTVLTMWILNFVIPSIIGSYYLFTYKPKLS